LQCVNASLKFVENHRFEIASVLVLFGAILWFDPRREHSFVPTAKSRSRRAQGLSRLAASSRPPEGLGLDWPEHGGTLVRIGAGGACHIIVKFKPVVLDGIHAGGDTVIEGRLSSWAASRVVAPLARANSEHAERLVKALSDAPLATRELRQWFDHYQKAGRLTRERLVDHPHLFLAALEESVEQGLSEGLRDGPEGSCEIALRRINVLIHSVRKRLPNLRPLSEDLIAPYPSFRRTLKPLVRTSSDMPNTTLIEIRSSVRVLKAQGHSLREISRLLKLSRNTVRRILREHDRESVASSPCDAQTLSRLEDAFIRACGNVVRVQQLLAEENDLHISYSTLTRWIRDAGLRSPPRRSGEYQLAPGAEAQHDTSPHRVMIAGKPVTAHCTGLVLAYSRRLACLPHR